MSEPKWLERELQTHLRPVTAPAGLWASIESPRRDAGRAHRFLWPAIAILMLLASADLLWEFSKLQGAFRPTGRPSGAEIVAASAGSEQCDIWSNDPARIRAWVKANSGIELDLPAHGPSVRVVGAKVVHLHGTLVASIAYEADSRRGSMIVWKEGHKNAKHAAPARTAELVSWSQGENVFAVSAADGATARAACMLCHPDGTHGI